MPKEKDSTFRFKDPFGHVVLVKRVLITVIGFLTYLRINVLNRTRIKGASKLHELPTTGVLFVSNHQSYYADVIAFFHVFSAVRWRFNHLNLPLYLFYPRVRSYYVAAEETMIEGGIFPKVMAYAGAVTVKRSWRHKGENVNRSSDFRAPMKIKRALEDGWLINFPQGTTSPQAPIRKGAASIIRALNPIVVPLKIDGFNEAFGKKGFFFRRFGKRLSIQIGDPIQFGPKADVEKIHQFLVEQILG